MPDTPPQKKTYGRFVRGTTRAGVGGGAILIGLALYLLFRGFGPGGTGASGSGTGSESNSDGKTVINTKDPSSLEGKTTPLVAPDPSIGGLTDDEQKALSGVTLTVLIDEHDYLIELPGTPDPIFRRTPLERIVTLATLAKGDTNGTKVRILRRESSRASAEEKLKLELDRKGIHAGAVIMSGEFVP